MTEASPVLARFFEDPYSERIRARSHVSFFPCQQTGNSRARAANLSGQSFHFDFVGVAGDSPRRSSKHTQPLYLRDRAYRQDGAPCCGECPLDRYPQAFFRNPLKPSPGSIRFRPGLHLGLSVVAPNDGGLVELFDGRLFTSLSCLM